MSGSLRAIVVKLVIFSAFTLAVTGLLAAVIGNMQPFANFYEVKAEFSDATGLLENDVVKVAGVNVGKVAGADVVTGEQGGKAVVTLLVKDFVDIPRNALADIRFRNLLGQRMVVIERDSEQPAAPPLPKDGTAVIPLSQTSPAFDLGIVFNNLGPALAALNPQDVNTLTRATVEIFAGREATIQQLVADLADLSQTLGDRGPVVAELVTELNQVVANLAERDTELGELLASFDRLMATLAERSPELVRTVENLGVASDGLADILAENRPGLDRMIAQLQDILAVAAAHKADLDATLKTLPSTTYTLNRATTYGEWVNLIGVCINGLCQPGFSSEPASAGGLGGLFGAALTGADR